MDIGRYCLSLYFRADIFLANYPIHYFVCVEKFWGLFRMEKYDELIILFKVLFEKNKMKWKFQK